MIGGMPEAPARLPPDTTPVLIGVGHATRRPGDLRETTEPAELIAAAIREALADARLDGSGSVAVDHLDVLNLLSWRYGDPVGAVAGFAGLGPVRGDYSPVGGDQPTRLIEAAARRIAAGASAVSVVAGGEALRSRRMWQASGERPPWTRRAEPPGGLDLASGLGGGALEHGLTQPVEVYPLVENAVRAGTATPWDEAQQRSARLWAGMSQVAARTPGAWATAPLTADEIVTPGPDNRWVAHPYVKRMCAQPTVDQAAAVVVASLATARQLGLADEDLVYVWSAAGASDTVEILERPTYTASEPMAQVLGDVLEAAGRSPQGIDLWELYSCFPIVPKLALGILGLGDETAITVAGGLTFYGGPFNAYMACAAVNMVRALRRGDGTTGLLYGNGEFVTKHHAIVVGREPGPRHGCIPEDDRVRRQAALDRRPAPRLDPEPNGKATIETWTVVYDRDGVPVRGVVIGRTDAGRRFVANAVADSDHLEALVDPSTEPIGRTGTVTGTPEGNRFQLAG
jgi:acetyl-CoA C-acetyltransferase